jgi:hypothetical protein
MAICGDFDMLVLDGRREHTRITLVLPRLN